MSASPGFASERIMGDRELVLMVAGSATIRVRRGNRELGVEQPGGCADFVYGAVLTAAHGTRRR